MRLARSVLAALLLVASDASGAEDDGLGGIVLPLVNYNSTDGFGLGLGGELFWIEGGSYRWKLTGSAFASVDLSYQSHFVQVETRSGRRDVLATVAYRGWTSMRYAGAGGADVVVDHGEAEGGNRVRTPYAVVSVSQAAGPGAAYVQGSFRWAIVRPAEDGLLAERAPIGHEGGVYGDLAAGYLVEEVDRWPLPLDGFSLEGDVRAGAMVGAPALVGVHGEAIGWRAVLGDRLVLGGRLLAAKTVGGRPFFEQEYTGGRWRDEIGYVQALTGYGRTRTRGDGLVAGMVEARGRIVRARKGFFDLTFHWSVYAEEGWLFDRLDPGPHLPTVGAGLPLVWQQATVLRPFVAWGWRSEQPGGPRHPSPQFGLALQEPL